MATCGQIAQLKRDWLADPCWDIEETEGYEAYRDELLAFRLEQEARWAVARRFQKLEMAARVGMPHNASMGAYLLALEKRIAELTERIARLEAQ